jgi:hypothetical protein
MMPAILLANTSPWTVLIDMFFVVMLSVGVAWYFYFYQKQNIIGGFIGATVIAGLGSILVFTLFQKIIRDIIMWLMSPKIGSIQLSNMNLIVVGMGAFLALYLVQKMQMRNRRE